MCNLQVQRSLLKVFITLLLYHMGQCTLLNDDGNSDSSTLSSSSSHEQFKCPEQFGYFHDPFDCSKYFVCVFGEALHEQCTGGLYFSIDHQTCDWPRNIGCKRAPVVTVTTSTSTSIDDKGQLVNGNILNNSGTYQSRANQTKNHSSASDNSDDTSRDNSRDRLDLDALSKSGGTNFSSSSSSNASSSSSINLSPVQVINYDSLNDSVLLDAAAATVDRRVGSHFQNQRLNQISHQYHLQRTPVAAVQSPSYSHYDIVDSNNRSHFTKSPSTDFVYFDEDRDSESSSNRKNNQFNSQELNDKNRYDHLPSANNQRNADDSSKHSSRESAILNSANHLTNLPLPAFKVSSVSLPSSTPSSSSSASSSSLRSSSRDAVQLRRPFVPPYSGFESTRNAPIRRKYVSRFPSHHSDTRSSVNNNNNRATAATSLESLGDTGAPSTAKIINSHNNTSVNKQRSVIVNHHDSLPKRRPPKRLELPSLPPPPPPPPHQPSSTGSSSSPASTVAPSFDESDLATHSPTFTFDSTTTQSTVATSNSFVLLDRDEESTGSRAALHAQSSPLYESYHHTNDNDKFNRNINFNNPDESLNTGEDENLSNNDGDDLLKSTRSPFAFAPETPSTTTTTTTTSTTSTTSTTAASVVSVSSVRHSPVSPAHGQPIGLFDYDAVVTESPVSSSEATNPIRLKKLLKPRRKPPPPSPYISTFDESPASPASSSDSSSESSSSNNEPKSSSSLDNSPDTSLIFNPLTASQPIVPIAFSNAEKCDAISCHLPDCNCGSPKIPGGLRAKDVPQIVLLTFDDAINDLNWEIYEEIFNSGRKNPNGCPILGTFYVSHEWTDYSQVQTLYSRGHEMASHGVSHSFGEKFTKNQWLKEVNGQRQILNLYGGVELNDVRGMRAPFLQVGGNKQFEMLYEANFTYDSSMPVFENNPPFYPYTLDFALNHECMIAPCPTKSYPGLWEIGMTMWEDLRGGRCSMADACQNPGDSESTFKFLMKNFNRHYKSNRAPFGLFYHSAWFNTDHHRKGFIRFIDHILSKSDVYFVTNWQMIQWMKEPTSLNTIESFKPWRCDKPAPINECLNPHVCTVKHSEGSRFMKTCQNCPLHYPWVGRV